MKTGPGSLLRKTHNFASHQIHQNKIAFLDLLLLTMRVDELPQILVAFLNFLVQKTPSEAFADHDIKAEQPLNQVAQSLSEAPGPPVHTS